MLYMLKTVLKKIKKQLFSTLKASSFYVLKKLEPDLDEESFGDRNLGLALSKPDQWSDQSTVFEKAVVINNDQAIASANSIDFYLKGVFGPLATIQLKTELSSLLVGLTFEEIDQKLEIYLEEKKRINPDNLSYELLQVFLIHRQSVIKNNHAYSTKSRINPNAVFWPDPTEARNGRSIFTELPYAKTYGFIDRSTPIVSAGSCFATEIAHSLQSKGFNYLIKEPNTGKPGSHVYLDAGDQPNASAAWGIIFNTPSFRQLVEKAFEVRKLPQILWTQEINGKKYYLDPFRENIAFESPEAFEANFHDHLAAARQAFLEMKVFIITLGLNEVWFFKSDGSVFSRSPWKTAKALVGHKILTVEENVQDLIRMTEILRAHNPGVKIICTLSPVGLHATFRGDENHVIVANSHSKAVLRVAAEEFAKRCPEVYYFPSYEVVTNCSKDPWTADQRHVTRETVANVMSLFDKMYVGSNIVK
jgi:hypothetical protein